MISAIRFNAALPVKSQPVARFSGKPDQASAEPAPSDQPQRRRPLWSKIVLTLGGLMLAGSFIGGGTAATKAMVDYDGHLLNAPSTAERDYIRSKTTTPELATGFFGGLLLTLIGLGGTPAKPEGDDGDKPKPDTPEG